jgi:signal transduction histidine kinase
MDRPHLSALRTDLFRSARLKLTFFYFAVLAAFCLLLTFGVRAVTMYELARSDDARSGAIHRLFERYTGIGDVQVLGIPGDRYFDSAQAKQADAIRNNLNRDLLLIDLVLLAGGAALSYWYAGRTLRPIAQAHEQQKRFTSDASHELRTPLAAMKLENEIFLRSKQFKEAEARQLIESNLEEVERLERLAGNLLALSRYEQGAVAHAPVTVGELVEEAVERTKRRKEAARVKFVQDITPARVDVNRESIVELISILLDNAVKYGPKTGRVEIAGRMEDDKYVLQVRDHGPGLSVEDLPHIFERMYRGDKARSSKVPGHGIGLSLAQQIAAANEATLTAANATDGGAEFVLTLQ